MIRSIRFSLTIWYAAILAVILSLFGWVLYTRVAKNLAQDIDNVLASEADGVGDAIFAFWKAEQAFSHRKEVREKELPGRVLRWAHETGALETERPIRLIDPGGHPLDASRSFTQLALPITEQAVSQARRGRTIYETFPLADERIRLITRPEVEDKQLLYLVQAAAPLQQADVSLQRLRLGLLWLIPLTLVVTSVVGWFLATKVLRPVGRMTTQARRIGAEHLHQRIDIPQTGDELEHLATTFNDMLGRLERAFRRLRQFSAAASHELRTPLTIMKGELEVALRKPRDPEEYQRVLHTHLEALNEMTHIVEELLTLARSEVGEGAVEWQPVELRALTEAVCNTFRPMADKKQIRIELSSGEPVWIRGEGRLLERLIANLLDNALKHTPAHGSVNLQILHEGNQACLIVQDTGSGIPSAQLPKIFDQFFSRRPSEGNPSTGLGLGLCRWIAEAHQGRIEAASPPGQGAVFTIRLPLSCAS